jgi:ribonuclease P protein component
VEGKRFRAESGLSKANRLVGKAAFREVTSGGRLWESNELRVYVLKGKPGPPCLGIVVRRTLGGAVERNRFKRRIREALRRRRGFTAGVWVVVVAKTGASDLTYTDITDQFDRAFGANGV